MNTDTSAFSKNQKYFIIGWIGILTAVLDFTVKTPIAYPEFIPFETEAPNTVDMVINHVIGPVLKIDLMPDLLAYLLIFISIAGLGSVKKYFYRQIPLLILSMGISFANMLLPFYMNGNLRFRFGYLFYFLACLIRTIALFEYAFCYAKLEECMANHTDNTVTVIFLMISFFTGFISDVLAFYQLTISSYIYYFVQLSTLFTTLCRLWKRKKYLEEPPKV